MTETVAEPKQRGRGHAKKDKPQHGNGKKEQNVPTAPVPDSAPPPEAREPEQQPVAEAPAVIDDEPAEPVEAPPAADEAGNGHGRGHAWGHAKK